MFRLSLREKDKPRHVFYLSGLAVTLKRSPPYRGTFQPEAGRQDGKKTCSVPFQLLLLF